MDRLTGIALGVLFLLASAVSARAQVTGAQVPENLVQKIIYVNVKHPQASDTNPGTATLPLKTVGAAATIAAANNKQNIGTKILIYPGVYRESVEMQAIPQMTSAPLVFEAQTRGQAILSGSDVWTGWTPQGGDIYTHFWQYQWGLAPIPPSWQQLNIQPIVRRREMIYVNGQPLTQVSSLAEMQAQARTFYVDETQRLVSIHVAAGINPATTTIEVTTRASLLVIHARTNIVFRGLVFQHDNSPIPDGQAVVLSTATNALVENCMFRWNNWGGLALWNSQNVTIRNSSVNNNGGPGITTHQIKNFLVEDNQTSYNNWRGARGALYWWAVSGMKNLRVHDAMFRRHQSLGNKTGGLWFDTDCANITVEEARLCDNLVEGLFLEANQGPITVKKSVICNNKNIGGVRILASSNITLDSNIIYGNVGSEINLDEVVQRPITNWETGQGLTVKVEGLTLKNNSIVGTNINQFLLNTNTSDWSQYSGKITSTGNLWHNSAKQKSFYVNRSLDLAGWRALTNQDLNSVFAEPRFSDPSNCSFALLPDSPLLGKQLPTAPTTPGAGTLVVD